MALGLLVLVVVAIAVIIALATGHWGAILFVLLGGGILMAGAVGLFVVRSIATNQSAAQVNARHANNAQQTAVTKTRHIPVENDTATPTQGEVARERPAWIDAPPAMSGKVYRSTLVVGPYSTIEECEEQLLPALRASAWQFVERVAGTDAPAQVSLADGDLKRYVLRDVWQETVQSSVGPMVQLHALLEFDDAVRKQVEQRWRTARVHSRMSLLGAAVAGVLVCLSGVHVLLRPERSQPST